MTQTPRTDKIVHTPFESDPDDDVHARVSGRRNGELVSLARTIERELAAATSRAERYREALEPLAKIPFEDFNDHRPETPLMGWNKHRIYVRDVIAARAALAQP